MQLLNINKLQSIVISQKIHIQRLSILIFINFIIAVMGFLTKAHIANILGKEQFGVFSYGFAIASILIVFINYGFEKVLVREFIHKPEQKAAILASSIIIKVALFVLAIAAFCGWTLFRGYSKFSLGIILITIANTLLVFDFRPVFDVAGKFGLHSTYRLIGRILYVSSVWIIAFFAREKVSIVLLGTLLLATSVFYLLMQVNWVRKNITFKNLIFSGNRLIIYFLRSNFIFWVAGIVALSLLAINRIILKNIKGYSALGGYESAMQMIAILALFLDQINRMGFPAVARITKEGVDRRTKIKGLAKYVLMMLSVSVPSAVLFILFPKKLLGIFFSDEYLSAAPALRILGLYIIVLALAPVAYQYIISINKNKAYLFNVLIGGTISIVLCYSLIPKMSDVGAALALLISHGLIVILNWAVVFRDLKSCREKEIKLP